MNRIVVFISILFLFLCAPCLEGQAPTVISLKGYLGKNRLDAVQNAIKEGRNNQSPQLILEINSNSGDLKEALALARAIYEWKAASSLEVVAYIEESAIGPSALLPFLADKLYASTFVSWGDIPLSSQGSVPTNILRNQVVGLIPDNHPKNRTLTLLAAAMSDPALVVVDENGWKFSNEATDPSPRLISIKGEPLVVNQNQLKSLGVIESFLSIDRFRSLFHIDEKQQEQQETSASEPDSLAIPEKKVMEELAKHIKYNPKGENLVGHIYIGDRETQISQATWLYVKKALEYYKELKPIFIIVEINSPGGEVFAAETISDALRDFDTQYNIPMVAYINNWAMSAGAMIAYSCRFIVLSKDAGMGAAEPIITNAEGKMESASEKVNSAIRADFANRALFYNRNPLIAEAMVDKEIILVLRHGKIVKLDKEDQIRTTGPDPDEVISSKGKLLTLNASQLMKLGVADLTLAPTKLEPITEAEKESGKWPGSKSALFHAPFFKEIPNVTVVAYVMDWKTKFFSWLANPVVSSMLFLGLILGFYLELSTPGIGLPGAISAICLVLIILSSFSLEIANWLELILFLTGAAILLIEIFVMPTMGILGFVGLLLFLGGLFGMMLPGLGSINFEFDTGTFNAAGEAFLERLAMLSGTLLLAVIIIMLLARYVVPSFNGFRRFVLAGNEQEGFIAVDSPNTLPEKGTKGIAFTTLRPAGKVIIDGNIFDAITYGTFIEKEQPIVVLDIEGGNVVVGEDK